MNLYSELNELHLDSLKVSAILKAMSDCDDSELLLMVASEQLDQISANIEMLIYKSMRKDNVA